MTSDKTHFKFQERDIVTISPEYRSSLNAYLSQPDFKVYEVMKINDDGTITLDGVLTDIPSRYVEGVPLDSELTQQLYYDNCLLSRHYEVGNVHNIEDVSARQPLMTTIENKMRNTPLWEAVQTGEFRFIHELQRWTEKHIGPNRIKINQFWQ